MNLWAKYNAYECSLLGNIQENAGVSIFLNLQDNNKWNSLNLFLTEVFEKVLFKNLTNVFTKLF